MMNRLVQRIEDQAVHRVLLFTPFRSLMMGAGIAYSIEKEKAWHIPLIVFAPSAYAGYHAYGNRKEIMESFKGVQKKAGGILW